MIDGYACVRVHVEHCTIATPVAQFGVVEAAAAAIAEVDSTPVTGDGRVSVVLGLTAEAVVLEGAGSPGDMPRSPLVK